MVLADQPLFTTAINLEHRIASLVDRLGNGTGGFTLCLGSTATSDIEGISFAGASPALRRLTPATDAEALLLGYTRSSEKLPVSPRGVVSPVVITRACLRLAGIRPKVVDCGSFVAPELEGHQHVTLGKQPANCVSTGQALPLSAVEALFRTGITDGAQAAEHLNYLIVSECVPGGTTTAMALLTALGFDVSNCVSSSLPQSNHESRRALVKEGLSNYRRQRSQSPQIGANEFDEEPLAAVSAVGDPMQAYCAGLALGAAAKIPVVLAGGSQMLAVYALLAAIAKAEGASPEDLSIGVITTKWVAFDRSANARHLSTMIEAPLAAACPDFRLSRHEGLRLYEEGNVKEGVGAGASLSLAHASGFSESEIIAAIDETYDELVTQHRPSLSNAAG